MKPLLLPLEQRIRTRTSLDGKEALLPPAVPKIESEIPAIAGSDPFVGDVSRAYR